MCGIPDASLMIAGVLLVPVEWSRVVLRNSLKDGMVDREAGTSECDRAPVEDRIRAR